MRLRLRPAFLSCGLGLLIGGAWAAGCTAEPPDAAEAPSSSAQVLADEPPGEASPHPGASFSPLGVSEGLPQATVWALRQDRRGFLWAGTEDGLARFDGTSFTVYRPDPTDPAGLGGGHVWALAETEDGAVWAGTDGGGLSRFDPHTERFATFRESPEAGGLCGDAVYSLAAAPGGLWVGTLTGVCFIDTASGRVRQPAALAEASHAAALGLAVARSGEVWIAAGGYGLARYRPDEGRLASLSERAGPEHALPAGWALSVAEASDGAMWAGFAEGLARLAPDGNVARYLEGAYVYALHPGPAGAVYAGTHGGGLALVHPDGRTTWFRPEAEQASSLPGSDVGALAVDRTGALWVGLVDGGLAVWSPRAASFNVARAEGRAPPSVQGVSVSPGGAVWVVGSAGLGRYDGAARRLEAAARAEGTCAALPAQAIALGPRGRVWTAGDGVCRFDPATGASRRYTYVRPASALGLDPVAAHLDSVTLASQTVYALSAGPDGHLWVGTDEGLNYIDGETGRVGHVRLRREAPAAMDPSVYAVLAGRDGSVWIGTARGLYRYRPGSGSALPGRVDHYRHVRGDPSALSGTAVYVLYEDPSGTVWVGTESGLDLVDAGTGRLRRVPVSARLGYPAVRALIRDQAGRMWLATPKELVRLDTASGQAVTFDRVDGWPGGQTARGGITLHPDGRVLVGTSAGLVSVDDRALGDPAEASVPLVLTAVEADGSPVAPVAWRGGRLTLPPGTRGVSVGYALLDLTQGRKAHYRYRLDVGNEADEWTEVGAQRRVAFPRLAPGRYTLRVQAAGPDHVWLPETVALHVHLRARWWQTGWARAGLVLALALVLSGALQTRARLRARQRQALAHVRRQIADDLHDDLTGRVAALALTADLAAHDDAIAPDTRERFARAARSARAVVSDLRDATWAVDSGHDGLDALFGRMEATARDALAAVPYTVEWPERYPDVSIAPDRRHDALLVYKEALHNAVRHGGGAHVTVRLVANEAEAGFEVENGGPPAGSGLASSGTGRGMGTMRRRAGRAGARFEAAPRPGGGMRVGFWLPVR